MNGWMGQYVQRGTLNGLTATSLAHFVESEIADRFVTHCGREMRFETTHGVMWRVVNLRGVVFCGNCPAPETTEVAPPLARRVEDVPEPVATEHDDFEGAPV